MPRHHCVQQGPKSPSAFKSLKPVGNRSSRRSSQCIVDLAHQGFTGSKVGEPPAVSACSFQAALPSLLCAGGRVLHRRRAAEGGCPARTRRAFALILPVRFELLCGRNCVADMVDECCSYLDGLFAAGRPHVPPRHYGRQEQIGGGTKDGLVVPGVCASDSALNSSMPLAAVAHELCMAMHMRAMEGRAHPQACMQAGLQLERCYMQHPDPSLP